MSLSRENNNFPGLTNLRVDDEEDLSLLHLHLRPSLLRATGEKIKSLNFFTFKKVTKKIFEKFSSLFDPVRMIYLGSAKINQQ